MDQSADGSFGLRFIKFSKTLHRFVVSSRLYYTGETTLDFFNRDLVRSPMPQVDEESRAPASARLP